MSVGTVSVGTTCLVQVSPPTTGVGRPTWVCPVSGDSSIRVRSLVWVLCGSPVNGTLPSLSVPPVWTLGATEVEVVWEPERFGRRSPKETVQEPLEERVSVTPLSRVVVLRVRLGVVVDSSVSGVPALSVDRGRGRVPYFDRTVSPSPCPTPCSSHLYCFRGLLPCPHVSRDGLLSTGEGPSARVDGRFEGW